MNLKSSDGTTGALAPREAALAPENPKPENQVLRVERREFVGRKFGRLTVISKLGSNKRRTVWLCICDCGTFASADRNALNTGTKKSCGCWRHEHGKSRGLQNKKHGMATSSTYKSWRAMRTRCLNPRDEHWENYGGRGITICKRWMDSFENFLSDMGIRPHGRTLDRININGNYEPENCRWSTPTEQSRNQRRNRVVSFNGETMCISAWGEKLGISHSAVTKRLAKWPIWRALSNG